MHVAVINGEPWIRRADMDELITICNGGDDGKPGARVTEDGPGGDHQEPDDEQEPPNLAEHRRCGHHKERGDCTVCQVESVRRRPHTKLNPHLSVDISGPHVSAHLPGDGAAKPRGKYFLICSITPLREDERQACLDGARAKEPWVILQGRECGRQSGESRGESGESRGESGQSRGESGESRGQSGQSRGESGESRGESGESRGQSGESRGQSGESRGQSGESRGESGQSRGESGQSRGAVENGAVKAVRRALASERSA